MKRVPKELQNIYVLDKWVKKDNLYVVGGHVHTFASVEGMLDFLDGKGVMITDWYEAICGRSKVAENIFNGMVIKVKHPAKDDELLGFHQAEWHEYFYVSIEPLYE